MQNKLTLFPTMYVCVFTSNIFNDFKKSYFIVNGACKLIWYLNLMEYIAMC